MKTREALIAEIRAKAAAVAALLEAATDEQVRSAATDLGIALEADSAAYVDAATSTDKADPKKSKTAKAKKPAAESLNLDDLTDLVRTAVRQKYADTLSDDYVWAQVVFDDHVIVRKGQKLFSVNYGVTEGDGDNPAAITFTSEPQEVREITTYEPVAEAVEAAKALGVRAPVRDGWIVGPVRESVNGQPADPTGAKWSVIVIESGLSLNRNLYPSAVIESAASLYDGKPLVVDHEETPRRFGRSANETIGFFTDSKPVRVCNEAKGDATSAVASTLCVVDPTWRTKLVEAWKMGKGDLFGLSHEADVTWTATRVGTIEAREVQSIDSVKAVALVTVPAAGGRFAGVTESADRKVYTMREKMLAKLKELGRTDMIEALGANASDEKVLEAYETATKESASKSTATAAATTATAKEAVETKQPVQEAKVDPTVAALTKRLLKADIREAIEGARGLPDVARTKLRDKFLTQVDEGALTDLDAAKSVIRDQIEVAASVMEAHGVRMPAIGQTQVEITKSYKDQAAEALDDFWKAKNPMQGFRDIYVMITGDRKCTGRVQDATRLRESLDTSTFDQALGDSITRALLPFYQLPEFADWQTLCNIVPLNDFRTQRRIRIGGYGNLSVVGQGQPFPALTSPTDEEATYAPAKRGGTEDITIETIRNDDVGAIRAIPQRLGRAAAQTLYEFVMDLLRLNPTIYDSVALAASGHNNIITSALSASNVQAMYQKLKKQTDMSSGKRLGLTLRHLWVPTDLQELAWQLTTSDRQMPDSSIASTAAPAAPSFTAAVIRPMVHVVDYWTDTNDYWGTCDKSQAPLIEVGFVDGQDPQLYLQDQPTVGSMFSNEKLTYKIRHVYGGAITDFRGFVGGVVP